MLSEELVHIQTLFSSLRSVSPESCVEIVSVYIDCTEAESFEEDWRALADVVADRTLFPFLTTLNVVVFRQGIHGGVLLVAADLSKTIRWWLTDSLKDIDIRVTGKSETEWYYLSWQS